MGVPSLNDLAVDGTLNTTNQPTFLFANKKLKKININTCITINYSYAREKCCYIIEHLYLDNSNVICRIP